MDNLLGAIRIQVLKGIDLVSRDTRTSDPYVVLTIGDQVGIFLTQSILQNYPME